VTLLLHSCDPDGAAADHRRTPWKKGPGAPPQNAVAGSKIRPRLCANGGGAKARFQVIAGRSSAGLKREEEMKTKFAAAIAASAVLCSTVTEASADTLRFAHGQAQSRSG
jgi:hypothetical protein